MEEITLLSPTWTRLAWSGSELVSAFASFGGPPAKDVGFIHLATGLPQLSHMAYNWGLPALGPVCVTEASI